MLKIICSTQHIPTYKRRSAPIGNRKRHAPARAYYNQKPPAKNVLHPFSAIRSLRKNARSFLSLRSADTWFFFDCDRQSPVL